MSLAMRGKSIYPHPAGEEPEGPAEVLEEILLSLNHTVPVAHSGSMHAKMESPPASMINLVALPARAAGLHGGDVREAGSPSATALQGFHQASVPT